MLRTRPTLAAPLLAAMLLLLTACSSVEDADVTAGDRPTASARASASASASTTPRASGPAPRPTGSAAAPASPSPEAPTDPLSPRPGLETAPPLGAPACRAAGLTLTDADAVVTPDVTQAVYVIRTTGPDCQLQGYPAVQLLDAAGKPLAVRLSRGGFGLVVDEDGPVTLSRSTSLSFRLASSRDGACTPVSTVVATLPGTGGPVRAASFFEVCGGAAGVSPVGRSQDDEGSVD